MSTKKRFTISPDLASGLRQSIQSAESSVGQLHYDMMSVEMIECDPKNPRKLLLSYEEMLNGVNKSDKQFEMKTVERDALLELAESIKKIGIKQAIEVYKDGLKYRIITGERRYWAARLAGQKVVPVRISQKPDEFNLRYTQWVENMHRQDLSLWEKLNNLLMIADAYLAANHEPLTEPAIQKLLGVSSIQAYRYAALLRADDRVVSLIQAGKLNNLKLIQQLVAMKQKAGYDQTIEMIRVSTQEVTSLVAYRLKTARRVTSMVSREAVLLGKIKNPRVAKQVMKILLSDARLSKHHALFQTVDWSSPKAIQRAFQLLFKTLEEALKLEAVEA